MQILLDYRPALRQRTGVGEYIHEAASALVSTAGTGERLVLFSSSWKDRLAPGVVPGAYLIDRRVPVRLLNRAWHRSGWPSAERLTGARFDVVHATHPLLIPSKTAARLVTIYDLDFLDHPERTGAEIRRDYPALAATHARQADQIVVISRHTANDVEARFGIPPARISICVPGAPRWPRREEEPASETCLLFVGTLEPRKNLDVLLDAYGRLLAADPKAPSLVLAGRITPGASALVRRAQAPPFAGRVELPGYVDEDAKRALFRRAVAFIMPSHTEGFGIPALEAMVTGVPVVAANRGALPEAVGSAGRLVDASQPDALAAALVELVRDAALRQRMREAGWSHAQTFTWTRTASQIRDAWAQALIHRSERNG